jgi:DNA-binding GntR family transcriptional regulator
MAGSRDCVSDRVYKAILDRICDGTYAPGDRLIELQIAKEFDSSQAPIREAFCKLEAMRVLETEPYKGTRVREISRRELEECLRIRAVLENLAAELVEDRLQNKIDILKQKALLTVEAAKHGDVRNYSLANLEFHRLIVEASQSDTLVAMWDSLAPEVRMFASIKANSDKLVDGAHDHLEIVEAFAEGDNRFAGKLLKKHAESGLLMDHEQKSLAIG